MTLKPRSALVRVSVVLALIWLACVVWMASVSTPENLDPNGRHFGMNWPGDLASMLRWSVAEIGFLWIILRPWSFRRSAGRPLLAMAIFAPYVAMRLVVGRHGGPIIGIHDMWLLLLWIGMLAAGVLMADLRRKRARLP